MEATITIRLDESEKENLLKIADEKNVPASQIVRSAIKEYLNKLQDESEEEFGIIKHF